MQQRQLVDGRGDVVDRAPRHLVALHRRGDVLEQHDVGVGLGIVGGVVAARRAHRQRRREVTVEAGLDLVRPRHARRAAAGLVGGRDLGDERRRPGAGGLVGEAEARRVGDLAGADELDADVGHDGAARRGGEGGGAPLPVSGRSHRSPAARVPWRPERSRADLQSEGPGHVHASGTSPPRRDALRRSRGHRVRGHTPHLPRARRARAAGRRADVGVHRSRRSGRPLGAQLRPLPRAVHRDPVRRPRDRAAQHPVGRARAGRRHDRRRRPGADLRPRPGRARRCRRAGHPPRQRRVRRVARCRAGAGTGRRARHPRRAVLHREARPVRRRA